MHRFENEKQSRCRVRWERHVNGCLGGRPDIARSANADPDMQQNSLQAGGRRVRSAGLGTLWVDGALLVGSTTASQEARSDHKWGMSEDDA
jgi:hypothetical protein